MLSIEYVMVHSRIYRAVTGISQVVGYVLVGEQVFEAIDQRDVMKDRLGLSLRSRRALKIVHLLLSETHVGVEARLITPAFSILLIGPSEGSTTMNTHIVIGCGDICVFSQHFAQLERGRKCIGTERMLGHALE